MDVRDPKGLRFLATALFFVLFGTGAVQGGFKALSDPTLAPHGTTQWLMFNAIKLAILGVGATSLVVAKKCVDKYADRRPR
jgi:hypothetical protein